jgi:heat shock protein HslJ
MDDTSPATPADPESPGDEETPLPAQPMGRGFWAVMALIGVLVAMIVYAQIQGVTQPVAVNLTDSNWTLTYYAGNDGRMVPVPDGIPVNIRFGQNNGTVLGGRSGCNWYSYNYTLNASQLTLEAGSGAITALLCTTPPESMLVESVYIRDLENTSQVRFRNDHLYLYDTTEQPMLIFEQASL